MNECESQNGRASGAQTRTGISQRTKHAGLSRLESLFRRRGRSAFVLSLPRGATVVDVGCGNQSPKIVKSLRPDVRYIGIDITDYNQTPASLACADEYILCSPRSFVATIAQFAGQADAVISKHNLEHCIEAAAVIKAMCDAIRFNGRLYVATPCVESITFPPRLGTLNFYDDPTHTNPVPLSEIECLLESNGFRVTFRAPRYKPAVLAIAGKLLEPVYRSRGCVAPLGMTWAHYGFESVLWATRVREGA